MPQRPRAEDDKGNVIEFDGQAWVPVQTVQLRKRPIQPLPTYEASLDVLSGPGQMKGASAGAVRAAKGLLQTPEAVYQAATEPPQSATERIIQALTGPLGKPITTAKRLVTDPMYASFQKGGENIKAGHPIRGGLEVALSKVPLAGPWLDSMIERATAGEDPAGALAEGLTGIGLGRLMAGTPGAARAGAAKVLAADMMQPENLKLRAFANREPIPLNKPGKMDLIAAGLGSGAGYLLGHGNPQGAILGGSAAEAALLAGRKIRPTYRNIKASLQERLAAGLAGSPSPSPAIKPDIAIPPIERPVPNMTPAYVRGSASLYEPFPDAPKLSIPRPKPFYPPELSNPASPVVTAPKLNRWMDVQPKQMARGANPAQQILDEQLLAATKEETLANTQAALADAGLQMEAHLKAATAKGITLDAQTPVYDGLQSAIKKYGAPSDEAFQSRINNLLDEIETDFPNLGKLPPDQVHALKVKLGDAIKWGGTAAEEPVNQAMMQVYGDLNQLIKDSVPGIAKTQDRWGSLYQGVKSLKTSIIRDKAGRGTGDLAKALAKKGK